ncbi:MAG: D-glycero-beta-D-manno-heptose-7-phosphate kinase [Labilithrix sp.]|nr:D-glycero-beta-D-manno-heptose-7-phosphate kinase [Labilithrix sp.]MCW5810328.1 D-glycero-beta-D-manno-heptose-7-phosphate kinase [Labilithrix sp.]
MNRDAIDAFRGRHVVVVGDVMLDEFARGDVKRISPEAPVPVLEVTSRAHALGGAANAAANVASLGGRATLVGLVGEDAGAATIERLLTERSIASRLVHDPARPTTHKTRLVARGQQIVRIDQESRGEPAPAIAAKLAATLIELAADADALVVSDYAKGTVSEELVAAVVAAARARKTPIVADPKHKDLRRYRGVSVITPNHGELELAVGRALESDADFAAAATEVLPLLDGGALLATRGADGMTLFEAGKAPIHVRAATKGVFDVTGAGDTVVATLAIALASGATLPDAVVAASAAAGVVVSKVGTASVSPQELGEALGVSNA